MIRMKTLKDLEFEIGLLEKCKYSPKSDFSIAQLLTTLALNIEMSISYESVEEESFFAKILSTFRYKKFSKQESWDTGLRYPTIPAQLPAEEGDSEALLRLKTSLTAFRLHSGPWSIHPLFGKLDKSEWEAFHVRLGEYLMNQVDIEGRDRFQFPSERQEGFKKKHHYNNKKKYYHKKKKAKGGER